MASYDIEITTEDTLELDTIIKNDSNATDPIDRVENIDSNTSYLNNIKGIQTKTAIFNPSDPGDYEIDINGQTLSIKVIDTSTIPQSGLFQHQDAMELSLSDGESVSTWPDLTDNGNDMIIETGDPTYESSVADLNNNPGIRFNSDGMIVDGGSTSYNDVGMTFILVGLSYSNDASYTSDSKSTRQYRVGSATSTNSQDGSYYGLWNGAGVQTGDGTPRIYAYDLNGEDSRIRINQTETTGNTGTENTSSDFRFGTRTGSTSDQSLDGYIAEFLAYNNVLSHNKVQQAEESLANKWGINI